MRDLIKKILKESEEIGSPKKPLVGDYILCIEPVITNGGDKATTPGKYYEIISIKNMYNYFYAIDIRNDLGNRHTLGPDNDFFKKHFVYIPKQEYDDYNIEFFD